MDTQYLRQILLRLLLISTVVVLAISTLGSASAQGSAPVIRISTSNNYLRADNFSPGGRVTFTVYENPGSSNVILEISRDADDLGHVFIDGWEHSADLVPGNLVVATDGIQEKQIVLEPVTIDVYDPDTNIISGTASPGSTVWVVVGNEIVNPGGMWAHADDITGAWSVDFTGVYDFHPDMWGSAVVYDEDGDETVYHKGASLPGVWLDEFDGVLRDAWYWINENPDKHSLTEPPGFLRIIAAQGGTGTENLLLRPVAQGDFAIETRVLFEPDTDFQLAGLVIFQDADNFLQLGRAFCDVPEACVGNGIYFDKVLNGSLTDSNFATPVDNPGEAYLRLERRGEMIRALYSQEGITWLEIGTHWIPADFQVNGVGLTAAQDNSSLGIPADFDYFELTEGWGFLPEGFHDYDQGDVPSWACNAGGWAVDPDNRDANIWVEIDVDGAPLPDWSLAGEYRPDLEETGQCVGGSCGFFASLWGSISSYETHSIMTYAQDIPSGEWVRLSNSPKDLTCRTYDIYAFDPLTGETKQITDMRDTDEYNPSWSPNGKQVAHDVVFGDGSQSIYVTDVKTGASTPLTGAENGGNDAVWSPNGKWIVFDRVPAGDPSLYLVSPTGGVPISVRGDAVSADWAPNGKRLVFQQPSDGSIRTVPVDGGKGLETLIAAKGSTPSWSPDGSWIAYEFNGDIWKAPVNVQGTVLGKPVLVASLAASEGHPTWSADSQTIVYHAGLSRDYDLWTVPAAGGMPTWLTGAPEFGDYDPSYARESSKIAYASFSPAGQAPRQWSSTFSYELPAGTWAPGEHSYYFENTFTFPEPGGGQTNLTSFSVIEGIEAYDGYALLRPFGIRAQAWGECRSIDAINPFQATRFLYGWMTGDPVTYQEAVAHFDSMAVTAYGGNEVSAGLQRNEIIPYTSQVDWPAYVCTFTDPPPLIKVQITDNWFEAQRFLPNTELTYQIYDSPGGNLLLSGTMQSDDSGTSGIWVGNQVDLQPGQSIIVSDGYSTKDIVLEAITFDTIDLNTGHAEGTAPQPFGRTIWVGIGFPDAGWDRWVPTDSGGRWTAEFEQTIPGNFDWIAAWAFDTDGDISEVRPSARSLMAGNFSVAWSQANPEEIIYLSWNGSGNLTKTWMNPYCESDLEFFGNSWGSENEGAPDFYFASLVGWGTTGTWANPSGGEINIGSISSGCPGSANFQIHTNYQFFEGDKANMIKVERTFEFGETLYTHNVRPFIPRLYPANGFTQVIHPNADGTTLVTEGTCGYGCTAASWDGSWFAIHNPGTGLGMIVQHVPSSTNVALWLDEDGGSFTNASSVLLIQPSGGFTGTVTETEYLCFYDSSTWTPSLTLPEGCQP